ncbi:PTS-dependent dihydroxyacetone kinase 2, dihydroxyacetone-binding subunit DhaK [bioreactor metagenome]|uniref:PTS-dependent dihydroxyacetone kinase 2, dihydroxyacetone-binding subunit DhaK n=1 Tax=bioreactor metagenome TaxID=1076179 RepID=A0A644YYF3_9ZZZZ
MKKILNLDGNIVEEMFSGYLAAYKRIYEAVPGYPTAFTYKGRRKGKVSIVIGGGSGHEPLFSGFAGKGLADAVASGNIFAAPNPQLIYETAKAVDEGKGVLFIYGCYAGDNMNFDMAEELCGFEDIKTAHVRVWDDCASAPKERFDTRRGIAGDIYVIKVAGAAADAGLSLEEVVRITEKARDNINSIGLATYPGSIPGLDKPTFELPEDKIEFGMGLHGEPGIERTEMKPARDLVSRMYGELKKEMGLKEGVEIAVLVNGLGATTLLELNIVYNELSKHLEASGLKVHDVEIQKFCTCQEMGGFSITILKLDEEIKKYYDAPCYSPYYTREAIEG